MHVGWQRDDTPPDRSVHSPPPQSRFTALFSFRPHLPEVLRFFPRVLNELNGLAARRGGGGSGRGGGSAHVEQQIHQPFP